MSQTSTIVDEYVWVHDRKPTFESSNFTTREENDDFVIVEEDTEWDVIAADNDPSSASMLLPPVPPNSPVIQPTTLPRCASVRRNLSEAAKSSITIKPASVIVLSRRIGGLAQESTEDKSHLGEVFSRLVGSSERSVATKMYLSPTSFAKKLMTTRDVKQFEADVKRLSGLLDQAEVRQYFKHQYGGKVFPAEVGKRI